MNVHVEKTVPIEYRQVAEAYRKVRKGGDAVGIDKESWKDFDKNPGRNLYVIWNRLASGSYHPQPVKEAEIPKKDGKKRTLGIPTIRDRIAQQVLKDIMEKKIDTLFHEHSYGYRPLKNAHQAIEQVRQNCYKQDWVIDMDIKHFFDSVDHELMLKAVGHVLAEPWIQMYVKRWLEMPVETKAGQIKPKAGKGTPQGGVLSPLLANLYLHFTLDKWLEKHFPRVSFVRYADDMVLHCGSKAEAEAVLQAVRERLSSVKLQIKEEKTRIAYCKDYRRKGTHPQVQFEFLGFSYQPRARKSKRDGKLYTAFAPEISQTNQKKVREMIKAVPVWRNPRVTRVEDMAAIFNPKLRGWITYYGKYSKRILRRVLLHLDYRLIQWIKRTYKLGTRKAQVKLNHLKQQNPMLFYHWQMGIC